MQVLGIAGDDWIAVPACEEDNQGVDYVRCAGGAAECAAGASELAVQGNDFHFIAPQESGQRRLRSSVAPGLSDDGRGHADFPAVLKRAQQQRDHALVAAIHRDQRAGVKH